jgi:hypothetical protein
MTGFLDGFKNLSPLEGVWGWVGVLKAVETLLFLVAQKKNSAKIAVARAGQLRSDLLLHIGI